MHHQDHPDTRDTMGLAGILLIGTGGHAALRERYGSRVTDGIAGETILLDAPEGLAGGGRPATAVVRTQDGPVELHGIRAAETCVEFSRFCLGRGPSPVIDDTLKATTEDLGGGSRGYRAIAAGPGTISVGDVGTL